MDNLHYEQFKRLDEISRQRMIEEIKAEGQIRQYRIHHPGIFERTMVRLAAWMISVGGRLRRRYEIPSTKGSRAAFNNHG